MSERCAAVGYCFSFLVVAGFIFFLSFFPIGGFPFRARDAAPNLFVYPAEADMADNPWPVKCNLSEVSNILAPSIESFVQATAKSEDQKLFSNGLAVYSNLTNACQPLEDVRKANIQVHKVALVSLENNDYSLCPLKNITVNAQNAGYSVLICFVDELNIRHQKKDVKLPKDKVLIPVLYAVHKDCKPVIAREYWGRFDIKSFLTGNDRTNVDIRVPLRRQYSFSSELEKMQSYLSNLYSWFLVGPIITLEWLRRTKKFCWMSGSQQGDGLSVRNGTTEIRYIEEAANSNEETHLNSVTEETVENHHEADDARQPLLLNNTEYTRQTTVRYVFNIIMSKKIPYKLAVGLCYLNLIIAALPVGISSGGLSFFRFDEGEVISRPTSYLGKLFNCTKDSALPSECDRTVGLLEVLLSIYWSPFQVFCFFMYSRFACKTTWTVQTNFSKLIRSDWFASNVYLLVLGIVVPVCYFLSCDQLLNFYFYGTCDTVCTISNGLFIITLNKHKFVTRYVFYISVCMICAYLESDVVAVFYFALNSEGSLSNLKLTALRTVAIGLTLSISFSSSMHIIRKLVKPEESLFEGLGEK